MPIEQLAFDPAGKSIDLQIGDRWWRCNLDSYELSRQPVAARASDAPRQTLQPFEGGPQSSRHTGDDTTVTFINRMAGEVELFWLDTEGKRQSYGRLRPGQVYEQHTYAGHVWLVVDDKGHPLGLKVAEDKDARVEIRTVSKPDKRRTEDHRRRLPGRKQPDQAPWPDRVASAGQIARRPLGGFY